MKQYIYIITPLIAWAVAQGLKHVFVSYNKRRKVLDQPKSSQVLLAFAPSGGMPSAHSATVVSFATIIGLMLGFDSPMFAMAGLFAGVVMYDAMMVRYSSGEQGEVLLSLLNELKSPVKKPKVAKGHLPTEVAVGALIGIIVAAVVFFIAK